jgi:hypothetical protein
MASFPTYGSPRRILALPLVPSPSSSVPLCSNWRPGNTAMVPWPAFNVTYSADAGQTHRSDSLGTFRVRLLVMMGSSYTVVSTPNSRAVHSQCELLNAVRALIGRCRHYRLGRCGSNNFSMRGRLTADCVVLRAVLCLSAGTWIV